MAGLLFFVANCERRSDDQKMLKESKMETWDIEARGLTKAFGSFTAVRNLNLRVPRGTIFGFLGPNGSGKSTTVKLLTGLLTPTEGDALIAGEPVTVENVALKRKIGVLPEDDALFRALTIWEHLEMSGPLYELKPEETESRAAQLLRNLDLWRERGTYVEQASFGMRKKCALAMALLHNPRVLFLDEPFEGIDPGSSRNIKDLLLFLAQKGATVFLTSHILEVVERLVGQYAIIIDGEIVCQQTVEETISAGQTLEDVYFQFAGRPAVEEMSWLG
jgi:ABC-2 type transport system ATP-binding protein